MLVEELQSLKYAELQKLAKSAGIRANQKVDKLIKGLTDYYADTKGDNEEQKNEFVTENVVGSISDTKENTPKRESQNKKRRRTFELEEPTLKGDCTPVIEKEQSRLSSSQKETPQDDVETPPTKRLRRSTFDKSSPAVEETKSPVKKSSPSTRAIIESIQGNCSSAERKEKLLSAIDKKIQSKMASSPSNSLRSQPSQIPRFMAFLTNKKKENEKPVTPGNKNWNKIHKKEFSKFDSIDVYLEKKQQRQDDLTSSSKKQLASKSPGVKSTTKFSKTRSKGTDGAKVFKPTVTSTKNINFDFSATKPELKESNKSKIFKPTVMSTKNISFDFTKAGFDSNKTPKSKMTTPSRKGVSSSVKRKNIRSTTTGTPFKFTGNTSNMNTTTTSSKKSMFDLKASLARPLTWKPHTGKLQSLDCNTGQSTTAASSSSSLHKSGNVTSRRPRVVTSRDSATSNRPLQAKNVRRAAHLDRRNNQKYIDMMRRRGLMA